MKDVLAEERLAQRLVERRSLRPPVDVEGVLFDYADIEYVRFPVEIDGLCLNLKMVGKRPTVLVNEGGSALRRRFTLAHELGHVLIPWHVGSIIDEIDTSESPDDSYFAIEVEANRFASELLMPTDWVHDQIRTSENPLDALFGIFNAAQVSLQAASIKFINCLPSNYVIASSKGGRVDWSSRSDGTLAGMVPRGTNLASVNPFPFSCNRWTRQLNGYSYDLWCFDVLDKLSKCDDSKPWREILDEIVCQIITGEPEQKRFKASINGVTSNANGMVRRDRRPETILSAMLQRLHASALHDTRYAALVSHPLFQAFCDARALDYQSRMGL